MGTPLNIRVYQRTAGLAGATAPELAGRHFVLADTEEEFAGLAGLYKRVVEGGRVSGRNRAFPWDRCEN